MALYPPRLAGTESHVRIFNNDGSEAGACGNGMRCIAALIARQSGKEKLAFEVEGRVLNTWRNANGEFTVDMGVPRFAWNEIPLAKPFDDTNAIALGPIEDPALGSPSVVNVGNPHCVFFVADVEAHDLARLGPKLEHHPLFPERANISLVQALGRAHLKLRTWERGAGLTRACGTAACAAAVAAARRGLSGRKVKVSLPGGDLLIEWRENDGHILMTGPYALDYEGTLPAELLQPARV
jgi:diaminopimelate epimerase